MSINGVFQILLFVLVLLALSFPLGRYIARIFDENRDGGFASGLEKLVCKVSGIDPKKEMSWREYAIAMLLFNFLGFVAVYLLQRFQSVLPLNPQGMPDVSVDSSFNTAMSFVSNTNWQGYGGETTMSYLTQMLGLGVQNFLSAATGIVILIALIRGFVRKNSSTIGNFWSDLIKTNFYVLLPLSAIVAIFLVSQGVVQTFQPYDEVTVMDPFTAPDGTTVSKQVIPLGPAASQVAIKQLGTNGGGFFNVNSAHPLENPNALTNFVQVISILLIPGALCITFGILVRERRQGLVMLGTMTGLLLLFLVPAVILEEHGDPQLLVKSELLNDSTHQVNLQGNMEGKEVRFGVANSAIWAVATTAASNGSVNSMHDSFTPLGGMIPMILMQLGEVVFGGVGSGLYGMIAFALLTVFVAGLMVGRTPEYLGKKIEAFEMKMVVIMVLLPCLVVLLCTAIAVSFEPGFVGVANPGTHAFSELLYAYSSMGNNNGSAFAGLSANVPFHNILGGTAMFISRYWLAIPALALAGSLAQKRTIPKSAGTLPTDTFVFAILLSLTVLLVGALSFFPALALGPILEHLQIWR